METLNSATFPRPARSHALDVLRGIAILLVLPHHAVVHFEDAGAFRSIARKFEWFGWIGVDLFFVLSGFLIGGILFQEICRTGHLDVRRFLIRRAFKIWPGYYALLVFTLILAVFQGADWIPAITTLVPNLFHLQNYYPTSEALGHTWSLAVEEHFYLLIPLLLGWFSSRRSLAFFPIGALLLMVLVLVTRLVNSTLSPEFNAVSNYFATHIRMDALLCGVILAWVNVFRPKLFARVGKQTLVLGCIALTTLAVISRASRTDFWVHTFGYTLVYLSFATLLLAFVGVEARSGFLNRCLLLPPVRWLAPVGVCSYAIYLWHMVVNRGVQHLFISRMEMLPQTARYLLATSAYIVLAISTGVLMSKLIEKPMLRIRDHFLGRWNPKSASRQSLFVATQTSAN